MRLIFIFLIIGTSLFSQKQDYIWTFGYGAHNPSDSLWGRSIMDFNFSPPKVYYDGDKKMDFIINCVSVSDKDGNFQFSGNGNWLENHANQSIEGDDYFTDFRDLTDPGSSYVFPLEEEKQFGYLYSIFDIHDGFFGKEWRYLKVDMNENDGLGKVIIEESVISDTLDTSKIAGTRHANGRDWWFLTRRRDSNHFFKLLFDGEKFDISTQTVGGSTFDGLGTAFFSPDGTKYANVSAISDSEGRYFDLYDFDRCTGELSNHQQVHRERIGPGFGGGGAFSPNSRFLYVNSSDQIFQYDTWSDDLSDSEVMVAEYDSFVDTVITGPTTFVPVGTDFFLMQLAPDNRIYVIPTAGSKYLHVIEYPDRKGLGCVVKQHSVKLPAPTISIPLLTNVRLGALEGSPCDTIVEDVSNIYEIRNNSIKVFPNPTSGQIQITWESPLRSEISFLLHDVSGRNVFTKKFNSQGLKENIDLGRLPKGIYFYELNADNRTLKTDKLVVIE